MLRLVLSPSGDTTKRCFYAPARKGNDMWTVLPGLLQVLVAVAAWLVVGCLVTTVAFAGMNKEEYGSFHPSKEGVDAQFLSEFLFLSVIWPLIGFMLLFWMIGGAARMVLRLIAWLKKCSTS